jgi:hypothetical protein
MNGDSSSEDGGRLIREDMEAILFKMYAKGYPVWDKYRPEPLRLTKRQRLRMRIMDIRGAIADRIGGGRYYSDGCDCDR